MLSRPIKVWCLKFRLLNMNGWTLIHVRWVFTLASMEFDSVVMEISDVHEAQKPEVLPWQRHHLVQHWLCLAFQLSESLCLHMKKVIFHDNHIKTHYSSELSTREKSLGFFS